MHCACLIELSLQSNVLRPASFISFSSCFSAALSASLSQAEVGVDTHVSCARVVGVCVANSLSGQPLWHSKSRPLGGAKCPRAHNIASVDFHVTDKTHFAPRATSFVLRPLCAHWLRGHTHCWGLGPPDSPPASSSTGHGLDDISNLKTSQTILQRGFSWQSRHSSLFSLFSIRFPFKAF